MASFSSSTRDEITGLQTTGEVALHPPRNSFGALATCTQRVKPRSANRWASAAVMGISAQSLLGEQLTQVMAVGQLQQGHHVLRGGSAQPSFQRHTVR